MPVTSKLQKNIPSGWQENKLLDCLRVPSKLAGIKLSEYEKEGDFPVFDQGQDYISGFSSNKDLVVKDVPAILFGDHTRIVKYIKGPFVAGADGTKIFWAKEDFDSAFLYYLVLSQKIPNTGYNRHFKFFKDIKVVLPKSKTEQQKIAEILGTVDEDISKTQKLIEATEKLKRGLMQQLFTRGIGHAKFKETKIGQIPEEWHVLELGKVCDVRDGTHSSPKYHEEGVPLITSKNLVNTALDFKNVSLISEVDFQEIERRSKVDDGDILFGMIGTIGNPVIVKKDRDFAIKNVALIKFTDSKMSNVFVLNFLKSIHTERQFNQKKGGSTQKFIALGVIRQILITVPSVTEQRKISEILSAVDEKISINKKLKEKLTLLKKGLMQDLLSGNKRTI